MYMYVCMYVCATCGNIFFLTTTLGVWFHFIHYRDWACICAKLLQSCPTLWDPMDYSPPGSSAHGILRARILEWVAAPSSRESSQPRDPALISYITCIGRWVLFPLVPPGKPLIFCILKSRSIPQHIHWSVLCCTYWGITWKGVFSLHLSPIWCSALISCWLGFPGIIVKSPQLNKATALYLGLFSLWFGLETFSRQWTI